MLTICSAVFHLPRELTCGRGAGRGGGGGSRRLPLPLPRAAAGRRHAVHTSTHQARSRMPASHTHTHSLSLSHTHTHTHTPQPTTRTTTLQTARALTALCAPPPEAAAHSRSALIVISREMTRHTGTAMPSVVMGAGGTVASSTSAVDTLAGEGWVEGWVGGWSGVEVHGQGQRRRRSTGGRAKRRGQGLVEGWRQGSCAPHGIGRRLPCPAAAAARPGRP